jgi:hypothetical protein
MQIQKQSLRRIVTFLNNAEEEGGFWLPNIQRGFVWSGDQIFGSSTLSCANIPLALYCMENKEHHSPAEVH